MDRPIFVDPTGRRQGLLRVAGRLSGGLFTGYLLLVLASLVAPPGLDRLQVPGVGGIVPAQRAPEVVTTDGDTAAADAVENARRRGAAPVGGPAANPGRTAPTTPPSPTPARGRATPPAVTPPAATSRPTSAPGTGKPTAPPGQTDTAPGRATAKPSKAGPTAKPGNGQGQARADATAAPLGTGP